MARRTIVHLEDDLSGGEAEESVSFALDGRSFEIDLSEKNAEQLRQILAPYISAGRPVRTTRAAVRRSGSDGDDLRPGRVSRARVDQVLQQRPLARGQDNQA